MLLSSRGKHDQSSRLDTVHWHQVCDGERPYEKEAVWVAGTYSLGPAGI